MSKTYTEEEVNELLEEGYEEAYRMICELRDKVELQRVMIEELQRGYNLLATIRENQRNG